MLSLRTARLVLEPLTVAHAPAMFELLSDPLIYTYLDFGPPASLEHLSNVYAQLETRRSPDGAQEWLNWIVMLDGVAIGFVQATISGDGCEVAYVFGSAHWGRGYALEAMTAMLAHLGGADGPSPRARGEGGRRPGEGCVRQLTFFANVDAKNERSIRLLERLGFRQSGVRGTDCVFTSER